MRGADAAPLKEHMKAKGALDDAARDALHRFEELRKMELWKEKHWYSDRGSNALSAVVVVDSPASGLLRQPAVPILQAHRREDEWLRPHAM